DRVVVTGVVHPSLQMRLDNGEVTLPEDRLAFRRGYISPDMDMDGMGDTTDDILPTLDAAATDDPDAVATVDAAVATIDPAATTDGSMEMTATPEGSTDMTTDMDMSGDMTGGNMEAVDFFYGGGFPERLDGYLVIEVSNIEDVSHLVAEEHVGVSPSADG